MRKIYILFVFLFTFGISFSQEELSQEEKERREKNIQAGNPFAKFGYKAKVATLSNGKYLEFHDLDSIVTIGSVRFHVDKMQIVGYVERDTLNPDAQPLGDTTGRWISVDPLSEEFPEWSPYTMSFNNPIRFVDPDGRAPFDWIKNNLTGKITWDNNVTSSSNTPKNHTYIGKTDQSIVANLFGGSSFKDKAYDVGVINVSDFNNPYSARGAAAEHMTAITTMSVNMRADVSTKYSSDGSVQSKEFNGVEVSVSVSGKVVAPYPNTNIKLAGETSINGSEISVSKPLSNGSFIQGGDVPTLTFQTTISSQTIQSQFRSPTSLNVNFNGQYSNNGFPMKLPTLLGGLSGVSNSTNLSTTLNLNNTANPVVKEKTN
jgi:hypothetical protein